MAATLAELEQLTEAANEDNSSKSIIACHSPLSLKDLEALAVDMVHGATD
jgi:hypothetical protein